MLVQRLFGQDAEIVHERRFQLLIGANVVAILGISLVSPILDTLTGTFGVSAVEIGLMVTATTAPSIVLIPIGGLLTDRYGRKVVLVTGLLLFGLGGTAIAFTTDFRVVLLFRLLQGIGYAGTIPVIITVFGDLYGGGEEVTAQGLRLSASGLSMATFPVLGSFLVVVAWQYPFFLYALALLPAIGIYLWFEEPTEGKSTIINGSGTEAEVLSGEARDVNYGRELLALVRHRRVIAILLGRTLLPIGFFTFLTYNSLLVVRVLDGTAQHAGLLAGVYSLASAGAATQSGRITGLFDSRVVPLLVANACIGVGLASFAFAPTLGVASVAVFVLGAGGGVAASLFRSLLATLAPDFLRGGFVSIGEAAGRGMATITPIAIGLAVGWLEGGLGTTAALQWPVTVAGALAGVGGVGCVLVATRSPHVYDEREL